MQDPAELKRQLESMERELYRVHCQRERLSSPHPLGSSRTKSPVARNTTDDLKGKSLPPLTRDQFIAIQRQACQPSLRHRSPPHPMLQPHETTSSEDSRPWGYVSELISRPSSRRASRPVTRQTSIDETEMEVSMPRSGMVSRSGVQSRNKVIPRPYLRAGPAPLSPRNRVVMEHRPPHAHHSPVSQIDCCEEEEDVEDNDDGILVGSRCSEEDQFDVRPLNRRTTNDIVAAFEKKMRRERESMQNEFNQLLENIRQEKEELKRRRDQEREKFYAKEEEFEKELTECKLELHRLNDQLRRTQQDLSTQRLKHEDAARDNERLQRDVARLEAKNGKLQDKATELQAALSSLKSENVELKTKLAEAEREARRHVRDAAAYEAKEQEHLLQLNSVVDENQRLKAEYGQMKEDVRKLQVEFGSLQLERERDEAVLADVKVKLQRAVAEKESLESARRLLEDRAQEAESKYKREKAEKEKAQRISLDMSSRQAEAIRHKARSEELAIENRDLLTELRDLRHENERLNNRLEKAEHERAVLENGKLLAEQEVQKMRNELKEQRIGSSIMRVTPKCKKIEDVDLIDNECNPISRLGHASKDASPTSRRPFWWHEDPAKDGGGEGPRSAPIDAVPRRKEFDFVRKVTPVPRRVNSLETKGPNDPRLELLEAEKNDVEKQMQKLPRNPAFRTSEEADLYSKLQKRLEVIEQDIQRIKIVM